MLLVFAMKCFTNMPCLLPHNRYCCLLSSPMYLPHLLICTCLISSPVACPPSSVLCWCLLRFVTDVFSCLPRFFSCAGCISNHDSWSHYFCLCIKLFLLIFTCGCSCLKCTWSLFDTNADLQYFIYSMLSCKNSRLSKTPSPEVVPQNLRTYTPWILSDSWATGWRMQLITYKCYTSLDAFKKCLNFMSLNAVKCHSDSNIVCYFH